MKFSSAIVTGGTFSETTHIHGTNDAFKLLQNASAPNAFHNSGERRDPPKCHPNTRVAIRQTIMDWIYRRDLQRLEAFLMWLYGPAGAGKSAICQTIADLCEEENILLAAFFFSRFDNTRNHARSLIATIVYQVALCLPDSREAITATIHHDPHIFKRSLQIQITSLLVKPLLPFISSGYFSDPGAKRVIVVDGLDECDDRGGRIEVLNVIVEAFRDHHLPLVLLIASRPEHDLKAAFRSDGLSSFFTLLPLDADYQSNLDIEVFLRDKFNEIKCNHPFKLHIPSEWPSDDAVQVLIRKSSGHFIYASTVVKFMESNRRQPNVQLDVVLGLHPPGDAVPFAEVDALYTHIFSSVEDPVRVMQLLAFSLLSPSYIVVYKYGLYMRLLRGLEEFQRLMSLKEGDIDVLLCDCAAVLDIVDATPDKERPTKLRFFHASLSDFLLDKSRARKLHIDPSSWHAELAHWHFQYCQKREPELEDFFWIPIHLQFALPTATLREDIQNFSFQEMSKVKPNYYLILDDHGLSSYMSLSAKILKAVKTSKFKDAKRLYVRLYLHFLTTVKFYSLTDLRSWLKHGSHITLGFDNPIDGVFGKQDVDDIGRDYRGQITL